jgi:hypothetical protein
VRKFFQGGNAKGKVGYTCNFSYYMAYYSAMKMKVAGSYEMWFRSNSIYIIASQKTVMLRKVASLSHKRIIPMFTSVRTSNPTLS